MIEAQPKTVEEYLIMTEVKHRRSVARFTGTLDGVEIVAVPASDYDALEREYDEQNEYWYSETRKDLEELRSTLGETNDALAACQSQGGGWKLEAERRGERLAEAEALLKAWNYWYWNANGTGISDQTLRDTDAFLAGRKT